MHPFVCQGSNERASSNLWSLSWERTLGYRDRTANLFVYLTNIRNDDALDWLGIRFDLIEPNYVVPSLPRSTDIVLLYSRFMRCRCFCLSTQQHQTHGLSSGIHHHHRMRECLHIRFGSHRVMMCWILYAIHQQCLH